MQPDKSVFTALTLFVSKKRGQLQMCIDYRVFNSVMVKNKYLLPQIDDLLDRLAGAILFSCIESKSGYYQIRVAEQDVHKMAMRTRYGSYEFIIIPFRLYNTPATFISIINGIFLEEIYECVAVDIDDIFIYLKNELDHIRDLRQILDKLKKNNFYVNAEKNEFSLSELDFLSGEGIYPQLKKIQAIHELTALRTQK